MVTYGTPTQPYIKDSPWNIPLPANYAIHPNNAAIYAAVFAPGTVSAAGNLTLVVNLTALGGYDQPCYTSTPGQARITPTGTLRNGTALATIPWDTTWAPNGGADSKMNIFDVDHGIVYELQSVTVTNGVPNVGYGVARDYVNDVGDGFPNNGAQNGPTGSGLDQVGGMIRFQDLKNGSIEHALSFLNSNPMGTGQTTDGTYFRYPASHSDGLRTLANGLLEGYRIALDPTIDLSTLGMGKAELMVATALQKYGAYCTDRGLDNNMAAGFYCEQANSQNPNIWANYGVTTAWQVLSKIPRSGIRVVAESVTFKGMTYPTGGTTGGGTTTPNVPPVAAFTSLQTANTLQVKFDGTSSSDSDGSVASWAWNFGDNTTATGSTATHTFTSSGGYVVKLTVTDNLGVTNTLSKTVSVAAVPVATGISSYDIDWGDGTTHATTAQASHTYGANGPFTITLTVKDPQGLVGTTTQTVNPKA